MQSHRQCRFLAFYHQSAASCWLAHLWWTTSANFGAYWTSLCPSYSHLSQILTSGSTLTQAKIKRMLNWISSRKCLSFSAYTGLCVLSCWDGPKLIWRKNSLTRSKSTFKLVWLLFSSKCTKRFLRPASCLIHQVLTSDSATSWCSSGSAATTPTSLKALKRQAKTNSVSI